MGEDYLLPAVIGRRIIIGIWIYAYSMDERTFEMIVNRIVHGAYKKNICSRIQRQALKLLEKKNILKGQTTHSTLRQAGRQEGIQPEDRTTSGQILAGVVVIILLIFIRCFLCAALRTKKYPLSALQSTMHSPGRVLPGSGTIAITIAGSRDRGRGCGLFLSQTRFCFWLARLVHQRCDLTECD